MALLLLTKFCIFLVIPSLHYCEEIDSNNVVKFPLSGDYSDLAADFQKKHTKVKGCTTNDSSLSVTTRNGIVGEEFHWKTLRYYVDGDYSLNERRRLNVAVEILRNILPCITFEEIGKPLAYEEPHVVIRRSDEHCRAHVGKTGVQQVIELESDCLGDMETILHEWIHVLGLQHEMNREDRDDYVEVYWDNILPEYHYAFQKCVAPQYSTYGILYNPKSIMHYDEYDFSLNAEKSFSFKNNPNIAPDKPVTFGPFERLGLQWSDIEKLRKMYGCG